MLHEPYGPRGDEDERDDFPEGPDTLPGGGHYTNSVLIAYAPAEEPQIAVSVVLEYGGGGANAAPVLRAILDSWPLWREER